MLKWLKRFWNNHFVKVKFLQSMIVVHVIKDNKKYLHISRCGQNGVIDKKIYLVEHLVNENYEVTDQTLKEEEKWFSTLISSK